jgi:enoyl-CoA hydratase/carnithine racemase
MNPRVYWARRGPIAELRFDNPKKFNAMTLQMWLDFVAMVKDVAADPEARVLLLRGEGLKAFISGADIAEFDTNRSAASGSEVYDNAVAAAQQALVDCPFPVVAAIHGVCMGGGLGLVTNCDLRYGAHDAKFRMPAARLGLGYGFEGIEHMVHTIGAPRTAELFFTARTFDGHEAERIGLVHASHPAADLDARVEETVQQIAANAPLTVRLAKRAIRLATPAATPAAREEIQRGRAECLNSADYAEGRRAFAEKRTPVFLGR